MPEVEAVWSADPEASLEEAADSSPCIELEAPPALPLLQLALLLCGTPATKLVKKSPASTFAVAPTVAVEVVPDVPTPATAATVAALNNSCNDSEAAICCTLFQCLF